MDFFYFCVKHGQLLRYCAMFDGSYWMWIYEEADLLWHGEIPKIQFERELKKTMERRLLDNGDTFDSNGRI